jgi:hypothetical protein
LADLSVRDVKRFFPEGKRRLIISESTPLGAERIMTTAADNTAAQNIALKICFRRLIG